MTTYYPDIPPYVRPQDVGLFREWHSSKLQQPMVTKRPPAPKAKLDFDPFTKNLAPSLPPRLAERWERLKDIVDQAWFDFDRPASNWFAVETNRRGLEDVARTLARLCPHPAFLAAACGIQMRYGPRSELNKRVHGKSVDGIALVKEKTMLLALGMEQQHERLVVAHEVAHLLFPVMCSSSDEGEETAEAFAQAYVGGGYR